MGCEKTADLPVIRHTPAGPVCTTIPVSQIDYEFIKATPLADFGPNVIECVRIGDERMEIRRHLL
jgi:hypothetical protein